ncbi:MAG: 2-oxoisovalerate dehydrogenase E2 component (dihydrolipoyl transacylase) [Phenylobacterium sp.]|jgi:2-oxoisovalerate dehydrogenase E2 component (dihydrolipoyl transacylase)
MSKDFILPDIGEGIVECEVVEWLISEGESIKEDQPVADVMTDKALVQIPSMYTGVVDKLYYAQGDIAKVHQPLFAILVDGEAGEAKPTNATNGAQVNPVIEPAPVSIPAPAAMPAPAPAAVAGKVVEDFILPDIGEGIIECEVVDWLVEEGELINEDQPVCDVMTDKALVQIPSKYTGKIVRLYHQKGEIAKVHKPLFAIEIDGVVTSLAGSSVPAAAVAAPETAVETAAAPGPRGKAVASPAVRRFAREQSVDITVVVGSGKKGRVYKEDIVNHQTRPAVGAASSVNAVAEAAALPAVTSPFSGGTRTEPIRGIKAAMAKAMTISVQTIPHFTYCDEVDMTELIALRTRLKEKYAKQDVKLTMMPFFMKAMSLALAKYPVVNSQPNADCTELTYIDDHNIGMAVDSKIGLLVPNVKQCQVKSIIDIATEVSRLTTSARDGRVSPQDLKHGTITISNIGALGGTVATPIINKPEVAIVALGKLQKLPRFNAAGEVEARQIMQISWSGDHRIIDGGTIARFCNLWKDYLEDPTNMLAEMR